MSEVWTDVTEHSVIIPDSTRAEFALQVNTEDVFHGYRLRKVQLNDGYSPTTLHEHPWAFIVERKEA